MTGRSKRFDKRVEVSGRLVAPVDVHDAATYTNHGCRCDECRVANRTQVAAGRARRYRITADNGGVAPTGKHNETTYSNWGCRCRVCTTAHAAAVRGRRRRRSARQAVME